MQHLDALFTRVYRGFRLGVVSGRIGVELKPSVVLDCTLTQVGPAEVDRR